MLLTPPLRPHQRSLVSLWCVRRSWISFIRSARTAWRKRQLTTARPKRCTWTASDSDAKVQTHGSELYRTLTYSECWRRRCANHCMRG